MNMDARKQPFFGDSEPACSLRGHWVSFRLLMNKAVERRMAACRTPSTTVQGNNTKVD